jgi:hypothetical protein
MSTRATLGYVQNNHVKLHLYREYHDGCDHLEITQRVTLDNGEVVDSNSEINIIVSKYMSAGLVLLLKPSGIDADG